MRNVMKWCIVIFVIFVVQYAVAKEDSSFFLGKWRVTTVKQDYECQFTFEGVDVYIVDNIDLGTQKFNWEYDTKNHILTVDEGTYNVEFINKNNFTLTPIDAPNWMEEMIFLFERMGE